MKNNILEKIYEDKDNNETYYTYKSRGKQYRLKVKTNGRPSDEAILNFTINFSKVVENHIKNNE